MTISPDSKYAAMGFLDGTIQIVDFSGQGVIRTFRRQDRAITFLAFSPDSSVLAAATAPLSCIQDLRFKTDSVCKHTGEVVMWDPRTGKARVSLSEVSGPVYQVGFTPNGKLAIGTPSGIRLLELNGTSNQVYQSDIYQSDANPGTAPMPRDPGISQPPGAPSGGGGLYSTAGDYLRFAQMVLNGGELNGVRLVAPSSIELMRTNHISDEVKNARKFGIGYYQMQPGLGFGYDFAILEDTPKLGSTAGKGTFLWDGVAGTWFWIDPTNDVVFVGIVQRWLMAPGAPDVENLSRALTYQALVSPAK